MNTTSGSARAAVLAGLLAVAAATPAAVAQPVTPPPGSPVAAADAALSAAFAPTSDRAAPQASGEPWGDTVATVGRLVWEGEDGTLGRCSGASVAAPNGSVVATAAHCLQAPGEPGVGAERAVGAWFVPDGAADGEDEDPRVDGWPVTGFHLPDGWDPEGDLHGVLPHDYAFVTVGERDGRTLQDTHGANRLVLEPVPEGPTVTALGYPAVPPDDGRTLRHCTGPTRVLGPDEAADANVGGLLLENCDLAQGASGGPWLQDLAAGGQSGDLVGVTSVGNDDGDVVGRPFPAEAAELHAAAGRG